MKWSDIKYFIPGVQIVYMIKEYNAFCQKEKQFKQQMSDLELKSATDTIEVNSLVLLREQATQNGNMQLAKKYDLQIADIALSYLKQ